MDSEKLLQRNRVSGPVLCLVRKENIKQVRVTFLQGFTLKKKKKKNRPASTQWIHMAFSPGKGVFPSKEDQPWYLKKRGI